jgi:hypothetical protein
MGYGSGYGQGGNGGQYGNGGGYGSPSGGNAGYGGSYGQGQGGGGNNGGGGGYGSGPQGGGAPNGGGYGGAPRGTGGGTSLPASFDKDNPYKSRIEACLDFEMKFSRYKGRKLGELAQDGEALLFFDWLRAKPDFNGIARDMVTVFLHRPEIAATLDAAIQAKRANARARNGNG